MIKSVTVKNYILIDEITLEFDRGFNVFTGETGAGKSIIIGAIDTALGAKANKDVIKNGCDKAYIELEIELGDKFNTDILKQNGIDIEGAEITVSREINQSSSRFRINGVQVSSDFIKEIRELILDIHSQHQSYNYVQPKNHIILLDNFALKPHRDNVKLFREKFSKLQSLEKELETALNLVNTVQQQEELIKFQVEEIENAAIEDVNEYETLEKELDILANAERLKELSYSSYTALYGEDENILDALSNVKANITKLTAMDESIGAIEEDFVNAYETLKELASQLRDYSENKENDNERMDFIGERLSLLDKMKRKYGGSLEAVMKTYQTLSEELEKIECSQDDVIKLEGEIKSLKTELTELSAVISGARKELAKVLSQAVTKELEKLELPKSRFEIAVTPCNMNENGVDRVEFLISTNVSEEPKPIAKTASGGEISRVMLAIKTVFAKADNTNTVIFDEIDTGISGKASQAVADAIVNLAKTHQIILITHQPIIAAKANKHFYVKKVQAETTKVNVYILENENRVKAIALLAAGEINEDSQSFAKNLLGVE
ncbi:DNA repair protein RecN [bacterium]|nr:DNA repair protein RecN [bacterium]